MPDGVLNNNDCWHTDRVFVSDESQQMLPGMTRPLQKIPRFVQGKFEKEGNFMRRVEMETHRVIQRAQLEVKYKVDLRPQNACWHSLLPQPNPMYCITVCVLASCYVHSAAAIISSDDFTDALQEKHCSQPLISRLTEFRKRYYMVDQGTDGLDISWNSPFINCN